MFNELVQLLNDETSLATLRNRFWAGLDRLDKFFNAGFSSFEEKDGQYVLEINVGEDAKPSNFTVDFDEDTNVLSVEYSVENENSCRYSSVTETLPTDADTNTIDASLVDGVFKVTIDKVKKVEEQEEEVDDTVIRVNRKSSRK